MTTVTAWWSRRSSRATAVVCSGRKRPQRLERPVGRDAQAAALVGGGDEAEQELGAGVVEGREAQVVDDDEVGPQQALDEPADGVVGEPAVERLGEARPPRSSGPGTPTRPRRGRGRSSVWRLAGARRSDEDEVLAGPDPLERGEVVEGRPRDRGLGDPRTRRASCAPGSRPPAAGPGRWRHPASRARPRAGCAAARRAPSAGPWR